MISSLFDDSSLLTGMFITMDLSLLLFYKGRESDAPYGSGSCE